MINIKRKILFYSLLLFMVCVFTMFGFSQQQPIGDLDVDISVFPDGVTLGTNSVGTSEHIQHGLIAETIIEETGLQVRLLPTSGETERILLLQSGEIDLQTPNNIVMSWIHAEALLPPFCNKDWGPVPYRVLSMAEHMGQIFMVRGSSDIYEIADLKGKRVGFYPGSPAMNIFTLAMLAYDNLTFDDVILVDYPNVSAGYQGVIEGQIDSCFIGVTANAAYELDGSRHGIRYLEMFPTYEEGWQRMKAISPAMEPKLAFIGGGVDRKNPAWTWAAGYPSPTVLDSYPEDKAYNFIKAYFGTRHIWAEKDESLKENYSMEDNFNMWKNAVVIPYHEGAVRYYKEIGVWTEEYENKNNKIIEHQKAVRELWDKSLEEAEEKGISDEEWPYFWMSKREEAGFYTLDMDSLMKK
jgi:hypothetical protein